MGADSIAAKEFYATTRGAMVARLLRERLGTLWPSVAGQCVLGLGYAAPYLRLWQEKSQRCIALMPARLGAARWPAGDQPDLCCSSQEDALPFPDLCFDRILLVHGLEAADNARRLLREVWRVLKDDGQVLIVAPNRRGLWAYVESTPFGQGQPSPTARSAICSLPRRSGWNAGTPPCTCRRCGPAPSRAVSFCGKTAPAAFCHRASPA